jgi:D-glucosaminate-6-phosphate ammonia-lyase
MDTHGLCRHQPNQKEIEMFWKTPSKTPKQSRRDLFRAGSLFAAAQAFGRKVSAAPLELTSRLYESIGVRPVINSRGTFTIITGSQTLPEVKRAMEEASRHFVNMDELMDGVGKRLADLSGAEWGIISNGCAAGIAHCTAAAIAGSNPERMQQLPILTGLKNEVIIPAYSRNVYDHAVRMTGVKIVEVHEPSELEAAFNEHTAMVYILAGPHDDGPLGTRVIAAVAKSKGVPVLVDAAAEILTLKPNVHLERGATAVAYSGGKCIRGPQAAGLLLGEKNWLQAAWINSAPHHAFGRALKVGKEEIMGMLAAVEAWPKRDHKAEWKEWESRLSVIADRARSVSGVTAQVKQPSDDLSNRTPQLILAWDGAKLGITGSEMRQTLLDTDPRIIVAGASGSRKGNMSSTVSIVPYQMMPGEEKIVGERIYSLLAKPPAFAEPAAVDPNPGGNLTGEWRVDMEFSRSKAAHTLTFEQDGGKLAGTHRGEFYSGKLTGQMKSKAVEFRSAHRVHGTSLTYDFSGTVDGDRMTGTVNLAEYGTAKFTAHRG